MEHVTFDVASNVLPNAADGGSVSATKLDDPSVTTFPTCCVTVMEIVDKQTFSITK